jgi:dynein light chain LC8-type
MSDQKEDTADSSEWKTLWGALVKQPCRMPHGVLKMLIERMKSELNAASGKLQEEGLKIVERVKLEADKTFGGHWHIVLGRNFGCHTTHDADHFAFFSVDGVAVLAFRT